MAVNVNAVINDLVFGDYTVKVTVTKASPTGPVDVVSKSATFTVPGSPAPVPSMSVDAVIS